MSQIFCTECGHANTEGVAFCENCGHALNTPAIDSIPVEEEIPESKPVIKPKKEKIQKVKKAKPEKIKKEKVAKQPSLGSKKNTALFVSGFLMLILSTAMVFYFKGKTLPWIKAPLVENEKYLFRISGSNTLGDKFVPKLVTNFLISKFKTNEINITSSKNGREKVIAATYTDSSGKKRTAQVLIRIGGTSFGIAQYEKDSAEIIMTSRTIKMADFKNPETYELLNEPNNHILLGRNAAAIIVNRNNSLTNLNRDQIAAIFNGEIKTWQELGSNVEGNINLLMPDKKSGTAAIALNEIATNREYPSAAKKQYFSHDSLQLAVANDRNAIGIVSLINKGQNKLISVATEYGQIQPTPITISRDEYPLYSDCFLFGNKAKLNDYSKDFLTYCTNNASEIAILEGFISNRASLTYPRIPAEFTFDELETENNKKLKSLYNSAKVLSYSFFIDNNVISEQELSKIANAGELLAKPENADKEIYVVGFGLEGSTGGLTLAESCKSRAEKIKNKLMEYGLAPKVLNGGSSFLLGWSSSENYTALNNRVEVFVK